MFRLESDWVRLDLGSGSWFDFESFERLAGKCLEGSKTTDEIEQVLDLGKKDFLPEYSSCEWLLEKKHEIDCMRRELILMLIKRLRDEGNPSKAVVLAEALLASDSTDEVAVIELATTLIALDRYLDAHREIERFKVSWQASLGLAPSSQVELLSQKITEYRTR